MHPRCSFRVQRVTSGRATTTSAMSPSPTGTAASWATRLPPLSRPYRLRGRGSSIRASWPPARTSVPGGTNRARRTQLERAAKLEGTLAHVELERKTDLGVVESASNASPDSPQEREKALRRELLRLALGDDPVHRMPMWVWRLGEALLIAVPNEPYVVFQTELRRRFPETPIFVLMTTNGGVGYLPPRETYGAGLYQEQQSPFAPGCLEQTVEEAAAALESLRPGRETRAPSSAQ